MSTCSRTIPPIYMRSSVGGYFGSTRVTTFLSAASLLCENNPTLTAQAKRQNSTPVRTTPFRPRRFILMPPGLGCTPLACCDPARTSRSRPGLDLTKTRIGPCSARSRGLQTHSRHDLLRASPGGSTPRPLPYRQSRDSCCPLTIPDSPPIPPPHETIKSTAGFGSRTTSALKSLARAPRYTVHRAITAD